MVEAIVTTAARTETNETQTLLIYLQETEITYLKKQNIEISYKKKGSSKKF